MNWFKLPSNMTAFILLAAAINAIGMLAIIVTAITPCQLTTEVTLVTSCHSASNCFSQLAFFFSADNPERYTFIWIFVSPIILLATSIAYFKGVASDRRNAAYLFGFHTLIFAISLFLSSSVALGLAFSTYYAFRCYKIA